MIAQQGRVIAVENDRATVEIGSISGCPACDAGQGCGAGIFGRLLRRRKVRLQVPNLVRAKPGQTVQLGIAENHFLALVFRLYGLPLLAGLAGAATGHFLALRGNQVGLVLDLWTLFAALVAAYVTLVGTRKHLREFPTDSVVHLLKANDSVQRMNCASLDVSINERDLER